MNTSASLSATADRDEVRSATVFVPPPLPAFLAQPCRPGLSVVKPQHASVATSPCSTQSSTSITAAAAAAAATAGGVTRLKLRRCVWSKIPASRVLGRQNVWTITGGGGSDRQAPHRETMPQLNFERIEQLFSASSTPPVAPTTSASSSSWVKYPSVADPSGVGGFGPQSKPAARGLTLQSTQVSHSRIS